MSALAESRSGWTVVTGASSGIGSAYARHLSARGRRVVLVARRAERLDALARDLGGEGRALAWPLDLGVPGAAFRLRDELADRGLEVDGLVNCAGLGHSAPFESQEEATLDAMIDVNVRAVVQATRAFLPGLRGQGQAFIVNVASNAAFQPVPFLTVYAATKAFVLSFTEGLAEELRGTGVLVQALCPGITATEFLDVAETHSGLLVRRLPTMTADEVVEASIRGLERGRVRVVAGWSNRALGFAVRRLAPSGLVRRVAGELYRPRRGAGRAGGGS